MFNILFIRCNDQIIETYIANVPVYLSYEDFRNAIKTEPPRGIQNPGKIYFYNNLFFINEYLKGIHVIDNSNPSLPQKLSFISIPGNVDIAIKNDILFADSYIDLISLDISDPENIKVVGRNKEIFPYVLPPYNEDYRVDEVDFEKGIVVDWELKKITQEIEQRTYPVFPHYEGIDFMVNTYSSGNTGYSDNNSSLAVGGSMARFAIINNTLFIIDNYRLKVFNIENVNDILLSNTLYTSWSIETLFPYKNYLFMGSQNGTMIYDISKPQYPEFISDHWYVTSCDPFVVEGNYAYITQRSGNSCGAIENRLDVMDISNIINPTHLKSYAMDEPYGLGIDDSILFVCDGSSGLKIYDVTDKLHITDNLIAQFRDIQAYNAIPFNDILMLISDDGLYQYDYSDIKDIKLLSIIPVNVK
ncbi:MAG: LVIVD repeat-containing protein [Bacteroidales bacterium]